MTAGSTRDRCEHLCVGWRASTCANQAEGQNQQDDQANDRVEAVTLEREADGGQRYARDGRGDEEQEAGLNEAKAVKVDCGAEDAGDGEEIRASRSGAAKGHEVSIVDAAGVALNEVENAAGKDSHCRRENANLQKTANDGLEAAVVHASRHLEWRAGHIHANYTFPVMPLTIISIAKARITMEKTARSVRTRAFTRTFAPSNAPASTPSITGIATRGSMNPRLR